eukprot:jgi/Picre1/32393/NNA_007739.t1
MVAIAAAIVSAPVVASRTTAMKPASKAVSFKAANVAAKKTNAFQVWNPIDNKFFETFSYLPPLSEEEIIKQVDYIVRNGYPMLGVLFPRDCLRQVHQHWTGSNNDIQGAASIKKHKSMKTIGTHSGTFHCDEALGCFLLLQTEKFAGAEVVRSRDPSLLDTLNVVIDVGDAGLVYKHFGKEIVRKEMGVSANEEDIQAVYLQVYKSFMEAVDAIDNGVNQYESSQPPRYINNTHLSARVGNLNAQWYESLSDAETMGRFRQAMDMTGSEFMGCLQYQIKSWLPARSYVQEDIRNRKSVDSSGQVVKLSTFVPWKNHIYELEKEMGIEGDIKYVIYNDDKDGSWRIQAVAVAPESFNSRKPLPEEWRGLRDDALSELSGIPGCIFVHASGFIGGNKSLEGVTQMAKVALKEASQ